MGGTEALYKQAGWTTPSVQDAVQDSTDEDDTPKAKNLLSVDGANEQYRTTAFTSHTIAMGKSSRGKASHGRGTTNGLSVEEVEKAATCAQRTASTVRKTMEKKNLLNFISDSINTSDEDELGEDDEENGESETEFEIPRSINEIYKISNRNRRNKKSMSGTPDVENTEKLGMDAENSEAEKVLAARGAAYFDDKTKRQKADEDELRTSQEEDISFMEEIGWVKDKDEVKSLKPRLRDDSEQFEGNGDRTGKEVDKSFDYSNVGNIGVYNPIGNSQTNPFFSGSGSSASNFRQGSTGARRDKTNKGGKGKRQQERPKNNEGRNFLYKSK